MAMDPVNLTDNICNDTQENSTNVDSESRKCVKLCSFNCKNIVTATEAITHIMDSTDILLVQEHWLFNYQLNFLSEISDNIRGAGKAVDNSNPISPVQKPRGYGGVGILWKQSLDNRVNVLPDGNERIQCVELTTNERPLLIVSVYLPSKGRSSNIDEYRECVDQLHEIISKFRDTHIITIGGDLNEDIHTELPSERTKYLRTFLQNCEMEVTRCGPTFIHSNGRDTSEIDYFLFSSLEKELYTNFNKLDDMYKNVSDHYPITCDICVKMDSQLKPVTPVEDYSVIPKIKWDKVDKDLYSAAVCQATDQQSAPLETEYDIASAVDNIHRIMNEAVKISYTVPRRRKSRPKLKVWSTGIRSKLKTSIQAHWRYKNAKKRGTLTDEIIVCRKHAKQNLRSEIRREFASREVEKREKTMEARTEDRSLFYTLIRQQRGNKSQYIDEPEVQGSTYKGQDVITGFYEHFKTMAQDCEDQHIDGQYNSQVTEDFSVIKDICAENTGTIHQTTLEELREAVQKLNNGKAPDVYGICTEHITYAGSSLLEYLCTIYNAIFRLQKVPDILKLGTISPVYKKKGSAKESKNYRGITVLPVLAKILEVILRTRLRLIFDGQQNPLQRGFTSKSSPLHCALIIEEFIRESIDNKENTFIAMLDAKAAFDVVNHSSLLRKLYNVGLQGNFWNIICSLHEDAVSSVKWEGGRSSEFHITQGVRQGGILSADLYKLYVNDLLYRIQDTGIGGFVGDINCSAPTCADDMSNLSNTIDELQVLCNIAVDYSHMERYSLQPTKSVILPVSTKSSRRTKNSSMASSRNVSLGENIVPTVDKTVHVGVTRSTNPTASAAVDDNIQKGRKTLYGLMSAGLHGENGLDPETSIHLFQVYVLPVLLYGLEVQLPDEKVLHPLDIMVKKTLKQILSLPITVADPVPYILSGLIPVEGLLHIRAISLFGNIWRLSDDTIEKRLAIRQLSVKDYNSHSWFIKIRRLLFQYDLTGYFL